MVLAWPAGRNTRPASRPLVHRRIDTPLLRFHTECPFSPSADYS